MPWDPPELGWLPPEAQELVRFACTRMIHSYKPVLTLAIMDQLPATEFPAGMIADAFVQVYADRERQGLPVERRGSRFMVEQQLDAATCRLTATDILRHVFCREQGCLQLRRGQVTLAETNAWLSLNEPRNSPLARRLLRDALHDFYEQVVLQGEAAYGQQQPNSEADPVVLFLPDPDDRDDLHLLWPEDS
jgi:hypothetical protein